MSAAEEEQDAPMLARGRLRLKSAGSRPRSRIVIRQLCPKLSCPSSTAQRRYLVRRDKLAAPPTRRWSGPLRRASAPRRSRTRGAALVGEPRVCRRAVLVRQSLRARPPRMTVAATRRRSSGFAAPPAPAEARRVGGGDGDGGVGDSTGDGGSGVGGGDSGTSGAGSDPAGGLRRHRRRRRARGLGEAVNSPPGSVDAGVAVDQCAPPSSHLSLISTACILLRAGSALA